MTSESFEKIFRVFVYGVLGVLALVFVIGAATIVISAASDAFSPSGQERVGASVLAGIVAVLGLGYRRIPFYRPRRKIALFERLRIDSPEFTDAALRHFRLRSWTRGLAAALAVFFACDGLISFFLDHKGHGAIDVLALLYVLLVGAGSFTEEVRDLRRLGRVAASDERARTDAVRSLALATAGSLKNDSSEDRVAQAILRRVEPKAPLSGAAASPG
jgi:hypothetical protein